MKKRCLLSAYLLTTLVASVFAMEKARPQMCTEGANLTYRAAWTAAAEAIKRYDIALQNNPSPSLEEREQAFGALSSYFGVISPEIYEKVSLRISFDLERPEIFAYHMIWLAQHDEKKDDSLQFFSGLDKFTREDVLIFLIELEDPLALQLISLLPRQQLSNCALFIKEQGKSSDYTKSLKKAIFELLKKEYDNLKKECAAPSFDPRIVDQTTLLLSTYGLPTQDDFLGHAQNFFFALPQEERPLFINYLLMGYGCLNVTQATQACNVFLKIMDELPESAIERAPSLLNLLHCFSQHYPHAASLLDTAAVHIDAHVKVLSILRQLTAECQVRRLTSLLVKAGESTDSTVTRAKIEEARQVVLPEMVKTVGLEMLLWNLDSELLARIHSFAGVYLRGLIEVLLPHFLGEDFHFFLAVVGWHNRMGIQESVVEMLHTHLGRLIQPREFDYYKTKIVEYLEALKNEIRPDTSNIENSNA